MSIVPQDEDRPFAELVGVVRNSAKLLGRLIGHLVKVRRLDPSLVEALDGAREAVRQRADELVRQLQSHDFDEALAGHGLRDDSPEWRLKMAGYQQALSQLEAVEASSGSWWGRRKLFKIARKPLEFLNIILQSVASAVPIAGGAYSELKDGVKAATAEAADQPGVLQIAGRAVVAPARAAGQFIGRMVTRLRRERLTN